MVLIVAVFWWNWFLLPVVLYFRFGPYRFSRMKVITKTTLIFCESYGSIQRLKFCWACRSMDCCMAAFWFLKRGLFLLCAFPRSLSLRWSEDCGINDGTHRDQSGLNVSEPFPDLLAVFSSHCFLFLVIHQWTPLFEIGWLVFVMCEVVVVGRSMATQSTPPAFPLWVLYGFQPWAIGHQDSRHLIHWMVWLNPFTHLSKHQFGLEITHGCHHPEHLAMDFSSRYPVFFHGTPFLFPQLGQLFLVLEEVIKAHWFDAMCMAFAAYIHHCWVQSECHHPSGGFFIPFLNPFSACRFESI